MKTELDLREGYCAVHRGLIIDEASKLRPCIALLRALIAEYEAADQMRAEEEQRLRRESGIFVDREKA